MNKTELDDVTTMDVSGKSIANLKGIEFFKNLTHLNCSNNQLTALDVSNNTALTDLNCNYNQLTSLDVSKNTALEMLYCYDNQLTALDVSKNMALEEMLCYDNKLTALDVLKNTALTILYFGTSTLPPALAVTGLNATITSVSILTIIFFLIVYVF